MHPAQSENTVPLPPPKDPRVPPANAVVATAFPLATEAAVEMLRLGGNAIDAAVAAAWALSVCEPGGSGLGGETSLLIHFPNGKRTVIDGHSYAPAAASLDSITPAQQRTGYRACTIPSTPATLDFAQKRYGTLPAARVMAPALRLAEEGYPITRLQRDRIRWGLDHLRSSPSFSKLFLRNGKPFQIGDIFRQSELAATLRRLAEAGAEDFYHGQIARLIAEDMRENGGLITEKDLADCALPIEREALAVDYRGYRVLSMPPLGGGMQLLLALKIIEQLAPSGFGPTVAEWYEMIARTTYAVFRQRERWPVGPDDLSPSLRRWLLSDERAQEIARALYGQGAPKATEPSERALLPPGSGDRTSPASGMDEEEQADETTHLCVADRQGNWVALTQSLQSLFGAKVANAQLGLLYNNYLYTCLRYPHPYQLGSRCWPQSNTAPTIVFRSGGQPFLALGAAGSRRIISSVLQVVSGIIDRGLSVGEAVQAPRVHALRHTVWLEEPIASAELRNRLAPHFPKVQIKEPYCYKMGGVQAIQADEDGCLSGAADPRRDGTAASCNL